MTEDEKKINKLRVHYGDKLRAQLDELMFVSMDQDKEKHREVMEDFRTNMIILWRMDRKLALERAEIAADSS